MQDVERLLDDRPDLNIDEVRPIRGSPYSKQRQGKRDALEGALSRDSTLAAEAIIDGFLL